MARITQLSGIARDVDASVLVEWSVGEQFPVPFDFSDESGQPIDLTQSTFLCVGKWYLATVTASSVSRPARNTTVADVTLSTRLDTSVTGRVFVDIPEVFFTGEVDITSPQSDCVAVILKRDDGGTPKEISNVRFWIQVLDGSSQAIV